MKLKENHQSIRLLSLVASIMVFSGARIISFSNYSADENNSLVDAKFPVESLFVRVSPSCIFWISDQVRHVEMAIGSDTGFGNSSELQEYQGIRTVNLCFSSY